MSLLQDLLQDPRSTMMLFLLALPGRMLAISIHEAAHAWVADKCGDPTARLMGRITLNPLKHFDLVGTLMLLVFGFGWAKPVPVNPLNYRNYRRDDLKVSIAGITANICLFLMCVIIIYALLGSALSGLPHSEFKAIVQGKDYYLQTYKGEQCYMWPEGDSYYYAEVSDILRYPLGYADVLIAPALGQTAMYIYKMVGYCMFTNLILAIFNLIPLPPLDGYHVLNDLILKKPLFVSQKVQGIASVVMIALLMTDVLDKILDVASGFVLGGVAEAAAWVFSLINIL